MSSTPSHGWFSGRTRLITIASIAAVGLSGAVAIGANLGILNAAADTNVGTLSAAGDLATPSTSAPATSASVALEMSTAASTTSIPSTTLPGVTVQAFAIEGAGMVTVATTPEGLRLDAVEAAPGWSWMPTQEHHDELRVTFTNGTRTLEFVARAGAGGTVDASVTELAPSGGETPATAATAPSATSSHGDDDHDEREHESDDDEHYEGHDDDD